MCCSKCGEENPDDGRTAEGPSVKTSWLAVVSLVLGILGVFTFAITVIPSVVLGIISRLKIEKSGGRLTGEGFAIVGIAVSLLVFFVAGISMPALGSARQLSLRTVCGRNLSNLGKAMLIYANDYEDELPRAGGRSSTWAPKIPNWKAPDRYAAYGLSTRDGGGGQASISSSFYLLVKYAHVVPKSFVCYGDPGVMDFRLSGYDVRGDYIDVWDFGPNPAEHCSYAYHLPYGSYALNITSEPGMAVAADRNPWIDAPAAKAKDFSLFDWDGDIYKQRAGNAIAHLEDGQNVVFLDIHVAFKYRPFCALRDDNIYTFSAGPSRQQGSPPVVGKSQPQNRTDSLLVNDGDGLEPQRKQQ